MPGADIGMQAKDPTIARAKEQGYTTAQFGKNHLGDRDKFLPTNHGFDEFFGNLYHLNAEEEPERATIPAKRTSRTSARTSDPAVSSTAGPTVGSRTPVRSRRSGWRRSTTRSSPKPSVSSRTPSTPTPRSSCGSTRPACTSVPTWRRQVGPGRRLAVRVPRRDDRARPTTSARCSTCSTNSASPRTRSSCTAPTTAPHMNSWPDGGMTPFRNEKNSNWEGAYRVPAMVRWPGHIEPARSSTASMPTPTGSPRSSAPPGAPTSPTSCGRAELDGHAVQGAPRRLRPVALPDRRGRREPTELLLLRDRRRRPDRDALPELEVRVPRAAGRGHHADLDGADGRTPNAEAVQPAHRPVRTGRQTSNTYFDWILDHAFLFVPAQSFVAEHLQTLVEFPARQEPASFSLDKVLEKLQAGITSS